MQSTFRRHYLDQLLSSLPFSGDVLDVGGKKTKKKGSFSPPTETTRSWRYVNIDPATEPDFLCSADQLPLPDSSVDTVLLTEVLEHLEDPERTLKELHRVLRSGGTLYGTVPFLFAVHGDPRDFQRWTGDGLRKILADEGFSDISVRPMGGIWAALCDLLESYCQEHYQRHLKPPLCLRIWRLVLRKLLSSWVLSRDQKSEFQTHICGGYFFAAKKN